MTTIVDITVIKERINKLLATASSSNQHEAELAMSMAQTLIHKHKLTMAELSEEESKAFEEPIIQDTEPLFMAGRIASWKAILAGALATANNCRLVNYGGQGHQVGGLRGKKTVIFGRPSDISNVRFLLAYAITQLTRLAPSGQGKIYANSWYLGAAAAIRTRLNTSKAEAYKGGSQYALVKLEKQGEQVDTFIHDTIGKLRSASSIKCNINGDAYSKGQAIGRNLDMNNRGRIKTATSTIGVN